MPEKTCGKRNVSPRFKLGEDSLAPGKSRTGNLQLPLQILPRNIFEMLVHGSSEEAQRIVEASRPSGSSSRRHASGFNPGFVTFVGMRSNVFIMVRSLLMKRGCASATPHAPDFSPRFVTFVGT